MVQYAARAGRRYAMNWRVHLSSWVYLHLNDMANGGKLTRKFSNVPLGLLALHCLLLFSHPDDEFSIHFPLSLAIHEICQTHSEQADELRYHDFWLLSSSTTLSSAVVWISNISRVVFIELHSEIINVRERERDDDICAMRFNPRTFAAVLRVALAALWITIDWS